MDKEYFFFNCKLEGRQLCFGDTGLLSAREVVRAICDADFPKCSLLLNDPKDKTEYFHEYVKKPHKGLYLIKAKKSDAPLALDILIDTRLFPNFILVEKQNDNLAACKELAGAIERSINHAADKYGWHVRLIENELNVIKEVDLFRSAMNYIEEVPDFRSYILFEEHAEEIMDMLHLKIDNKVQAPTIMCVLKAAIDCGLISKPSYRVFIMEFGKENIVSYSTYKRYTKEHDNSILEDNVYKNYLNHFLMCKDKWMNEIS